MAAAWNDGLQVTVEGYDDGVLVATQIITRELVTFVGFDSVDSLDVLPDHGDRCICHELGRYSEVILFPRQAVKVDWAMKRVIHHEDAETVFG